MNKQTQSDAVLARLLQEEELGIVTAVPAPVSSHAPFLSPCSHPHAHGQGGHQHHSQQWRPESAPSDELDDPTPDIHELFLVRDGVTGVV